MIDLDAKGLCKVIEQCRTSGVSNLRITDGGMEISYDPNYTPPQEFSDTPGIVDLTLPPTNAHQIEEYGADQIAAREGDEYLANLILEDPERYEELVASGEFDEEEADEHQS